MLGQLVGLFREGDVLNKVKSTLNINCNLSKKIPLNELTDIRNKCTHTEYTPTLEELGVFHANLRVLLSEFKFITTQASAPPAVNSVHQQPSKPFYQKPLFYLFVAILLGLGVVGSLHWGYLLWFNGGIDLDKTKNDEQWYRWGNDW